MSDIKALPTTWQKVQFDAITGTKSPLGSNQALLSATEYGFSAVLCQHSTPQRATIDKR